MQARAGKRPLVSVGIPVYNGEQYLADALASALAQDYENFEIVVSDNASTDGTEEICCRFAGQDGRVRYLRNAENVGACRNFSRVLAEARGEYFTWLAHDDLLSDPSYLRKSCDVLQCNPDVVLCATSVNVLDYLGPGTSTVASLAPIYPDRDWRQARKCFFRCPYDTLVSNAVYGVFRRDVLLTVPLLERWHKGQRVSLDLENPILAEVATRGRIVALPECLRSYRENPASSWHADVDRLGPWDLLLVNLDMKLRILRIALRAPLPLRQRLELACLCLGNFFRQPCSVPSSYKNQIKNFKWHVRQLKVVCDARLKRIEELQATCDAQDQTIRRLSAEREDHLALLGRLAGAGDDQAPPAAIDGDPTPLAARLCQLERQLAQASGERDALRQKLDAALRNSALRNVPRRLFAKLAGRLRRGFGAAGG